MIPKFYSRYDRPSVSGLSCTTPTRTSQEFKDEVNINNLLKRYIGQAQVMGVPVSELLPKLGSAAYGDFTNLESYQEMANKQAHLQQLFDALPSDVKRKYGDRLDSFIGALGTESEFKYLAEHGVLNRYEVDNYFKTKSDMEAQLGGKNPVSPAPVQNVESVDKSST